MYCIISLLLVHVTTLLVVLYKRLYYIINERIFISIKLINGFFTHAQFGSNIIHTYTLKPKLHKQFVCCVLYSFAGSYYFCHNRMQNYGNFLCNASFHVNKLLPFIIFNLLKRELSCAVYNKLYL